jgi:phospholipid-binding lipoprotein MlaA
MPKPIASAKPKLRLILSAAAEISRKAWLCRFRRRPRGNAAMRRWMLLGAAALALVGHSSLALAEAAPPPQGAVADPWIGFNRTSFAIHEAADKAVLGPVATGYRTVTPKFFRTGVRNLSRNLNAPGTLANDVLQGEGRRAGTTLGRFLINTTIGVVGVFDPASSMGLAYHDEDFGQTLAVWGVPAGPYLFVPLRGPTNLRDLLASPVDIAANPLSYLNDRSPAAIDGALGALNARVDLNDQIKTLRMSPNPYISYRSYATVAREAQIANGRDTSQELPDYGVEQAPGPSPSAP